MKILHTKLLLHFAIVLSIALTFFGCSKSSDSTSSSAGNFSWLYNGTNHTTNLDTAFVSGWGLSIPPHSLFGGYPRPPYGFQVRVIFTLTSFNVGNYSINSNPPNANSLEFYADDGSDLIGASGTINITSNNGTYLTGDFSTTVTNGTSVTSQLSGSFTNMPIRP